VLNTLLKSAARLCEADKGQILTGKDARYYTAASYRHTPEYKGIRRPIAAYNVLALTSEQTLEPYQCARTPRLSGEFTAELPWDTIVSNAVRFVARRRRDAAD
jgi:hypothetical protein